MEEAIRLREVVKSYRIPSSLPWRPARRVQALAGASFVCPRARITCLLGPNGAGKTTVLKILAGLVLPDSGEAICAGLPLRGSPRELASTVGIATPNERSFSWRLSGRNNLEFFASLHGLRGKERAARVREVLDAAGLDAQTADKPCMGYSSGMRQKLLVARALLGRPRILLLDEPTSRLDPAARAGMHALVRELVERNGTTVLLSTHDLAEAQALADHLVLLGSGRTLAEGTLDGLRSLLRSVDRVALEFERPPRDGWLRGLAGVSIGGASAAGSGAAQLTDHHVELFVQDAERAIPDIVRAAVDAGGRLLACARVEESLPEIFARLTEQEAQREAS